MFDYLTIDNFDLTGKKVGIRIDTNSPIIDGKLVKTKHLTRSMRTINDLVKKGAKVLILGHQGRESEKSCISLKKHIELMEEDLNLPIKFIPEFNLKKIEDNLNSKRENVLLLENIRLTQDEANPQKEENFILSLQDMLDYYILENFSLVHNNHASVAHITKIPVLAGRVMERELSHLSKIDDLKRPKVFVFGGVKVKEILELIQISLKKNDVDKILLSGALGELALIARGYSLGKKEKFLKKHDLLQYVDVMGELIKENPDVFMFPSDVAIFDGENRVEIDVRDFDLNEETLSKYEISDIGMKTVDIYETVLQEAESIYFKGPAGNFEKEEFEKGSKELIRAIATSNAFTFMGGGHSTLAAKMFNMIKQFSYVSLAGTALVDFLCEKSLPGLECLKQSYEKFHNGQCDFIVIGSNTMDIKTDIPQKLSQMEMGEKIKVEENFKFNTGGGGVNVSIAMSKIGSNIGYLGKISTENKELLTKTLEDNSIRLIPSKETKRPCAKSILLQTQDNDRVILTYRGHNSYLNIEDINLDELKSNNFYFTSLNDEAFVAEIEIAKQIKQKNKNVTICFNPSSHAIQSEERIKELIALSDVLIFNFDEAKELTGERDIDECLVKVHEMGPKLVVITDGIHGTYAFNGKKQYFQQAKEAKKVVDTTGAGDCFAATFFYFYAKGYGTKSSLFYAAVNAANLITKVGTQNGLLTYNELVKKKRM